jgi:hypothetical protein
VFVSSSSQSRSPGWVACASDPLHHGLQGGCHQPPAIDPASPPLPHPFCLWSPVEPSPMACYRRLHGAPQPMSPLHHRPPRWSLTPTGYRFGTPSPPPPIPPPCTAILARSSPVCHDPKVVASPCHPAPVCHDPLHNLCLSSPQPSPLHLWTPWSLTSPATSISCEAFFYCNQLMYFVVVFGSIQGEEEPILYDSSR